MINYRTIFNPSYSYIGILIIGVLILFIFLNNKNIRKSFNQIGKISIFSGIFTLLFAYLIKLLINNNFTYSSKLFIQVISKNVIKSLVTSSLMIILLGIILLLISQFFLKPSKADAS